MNTPQSKWKPNIQAVFPNVKVSLPRREYNFQKLLRLNIIMAHQNKMHGKAVLSKRLTTNKYQK